MTVNLVLIGKDRIVCERSLAHGHITLRQWVPHRYHCHGTSTTFESTSINPFKKKIEGGGEGIMIENYNQIPFVPQIIEMNTTIFSPSTHPCNDEKQKSNLT